jgi:hypothetical protein
MNTEDFRAQVRALLGRRQGTASSGVVPAGGPATGLCVPLRLCSTGDLDVLAELVRRLAASPTLAAAHANALLRFELTIAPAMATAAAPGSAMSAQPACCDDCARGEPCRCAPAQAGQRGAAPATPLLRGCITERDIKALPADCRLVGTAPRAVLTPLARDALRQRGIAVHPFKES